MSVEVICSNCGKAVTRFPSEAQSKNTFCSKECYWQYAKGVSRPWAVGVRAEKMRTTAVARFWQKIAKGTPNECWEWTGYRQKRGYGITSWHAKLMLAHRVALALTDGDWDSPLHVCHTCDNPPCCNPAHLWRGNDRDNAADAISKGRFVFSARGQANVRSKLTDEAAKEIKSSTARGVDLARKYNVTKALIGHIRKNRAWRHIP